MRRAITRRFIGIAVAAVAFVGCELDPFGTGDGGETPVGSVDQPIEADEFAQSLGMAYYDANVSLENPLLVVVRGFANQRVGTFQVSVDESGDGVARYTDLDGRIAEVTYAALDAPRTAEADPAVVATRVAAAGVELDIESLLDGAYPDMPVREQLLIVRVPDGTPQPANTGTRMGETGLEAILVTVADGQPMVEGQDVMDWLVSVGAGALLSDPLLLRIAAIQEDQNLMTAVYDRVHELQHDAGGFIGDTEGMVQQPMHLSPLCVHVLGFFASSGAITCSVCAGAVLTAAPTGGGSGFFGVPACTWCLVSGGISVVDGIACAASYVNRTTEDYCSNQYQCEHPWEGATLADNGHACFCECVEQRCENFCSQQATARSIPIGGTVAGACQATAGSAPCTCNLDLNAYCARMHPTTYCSGATEYSNGAVNCPSACGNGIVETGCPANPAYSEQCEPDVSEICPTGQVCDRTTCQCRDPECGNARIEPGEQCEFFLSGNGDFGCQSLLEECNNQCQCVPTDNCMNRALDEGEECDPSSGLPNGGCTAPEECDEFCGCHDPNELCGNGVCDAEQGEETTCPQDCPSTCGDGICNRTAGEATTCPEDCATNACCEANNGCPSEERYSCPGPCCCCPAGAVCVGSAGNWTCGF